MSRVDTRLNEVEMNVLKYTRLSWCEVCVAIGVRTRAVASACSLFVLRILLFLNVEVSKTRY